jgi:Ca2+-binding RTX toxin-like protein
VEGTVGADALAGGDGNDTLDGGAGADTLAGGLGDDVYIVDNKGDFVVEAPNGGIDEIRTALDFFALGANVENLTFTGTGSFLARGNDLDNVITGSDGTNSFWGGDGNDSLIGGDGSDTLRGGTGNDRLIGGRGDDTLNGEVGADTMIGGDGNDAYFVDNTGDVVVESPDGGRDLIQTTVDYTLPANVERLFLVGAAREGHGNALDNDIADYTNTDGIETISLYGYDGNDTIAGSNAPNYIDSGTGDDAIAAGGGNDTLIGGEGNDWLHGGAGDDSLIGGPGIDTLMGGTGADHFVFLKGDSGATAATADRITDFSHAEGDKIDLSALGGLHFIGNAAFTSQGSELRVDNQGITADFNGDGLVDLHILVNNPTALVANDFVL